MKIGSLCSGYGGLEIALQLAHPQARVAWHAEIDPAASRVLDRRWMHVPNLGDIIAVGWNGVPRVHWLTAGYPCQPFSLAGSRKGTTDDRHLWPHIADAIRVLRPSSVLLENVAGHLSLGFDRVLADLAALGFDARWGCVRASDAGAPHRRERLFVVATDTARDAWRFGHRDRRAAAHPDGVRSHGPRARNGWRSEPAHRGIAPADAGGERVEGRDEPDRSRPSSERRPADRRAAPNPDGGGREECPQRDGLPQRPELDPPRRRNPDGLGVPSWGAYEPAIRRWERATGRPAPRPTEPGRNGERLSPRFVEWLMGLPAGWVTDVPGLTRTQQLKCLGNGVVPQQALLALHLLDQSSVAA